jgi:hypothetical protein
VKKQYSFQGKQVMSAFSGKQGKKAMSRYRADKSAKCVENDKNWAAVSPADQLDVLSRRPGKSARQVARVAAKMGK